jgi:hypothetical protein
MKNTTAQFVSIVSKIKMQHIQIAVMVMVALMLALGAGAPTDGGGIGH